MFSWCLGGEKGFEVIFGLLGFFFFSKAYFPL
jgi:hypothetical protein